MADFPILPGDSSEDDSILRELGWRGDPLIYRPRCRRIRALAIEGRGPLAWMERFLAACKKGEV